VYDDPKHFASLYDAAASAREFGFTATDAAGVCEWQNALRPRLRAALGLTAMERDLRGYRATAESVDSVECADHVRELWRIWVEPTVPLPFYLLRPKTVRGRVPLVLTPHGHSHPHLYAGIVHSEEERKSVEEGERDIAVQAVRQGYLALAPTTRGFGDTRTASDRAAGALSSCRTELMHALLAGRTPIGARVWDMSRLIDWAVTRNDVDPDRIAITGNSGGGTVSLFAAACELRIAVSVPSCYFCTFRGSIGSIRHCDCNYVPGILRLGEMDDVAGLIAPRPFQAIAGETDDIFPIEHVRAAFENLRRIYRAAGAPDACGLYVGPGGHRYYSAGAWPFIGRHFGSGK
jgi:hypothetical protein